VHDERGSVTPLLAVLVLAVGGLCLGLGRLGGTANAMAKAQTAADAAALAGAVDGEDAARELAAANGATVVSIDGDGPEMQVTVRLHGVEARARASGTMQGAARAFGQATGVMGLQPPMQAALAKAEQLLGQSVPITSGWRSFSDQERLWEHRGDNPYPVAEPGTSMHERGLAVDVPVSFVPRLVRVARQAGLCHPYPDTDPVHFEVCR
jgi:D-alanyl-D-alanine carboxypeptidase-like protein/putative Flp pilus-assembly TadE/G-like protein